jgi:NAD(P)-dependent dehydrogenase (short-subunit alcohol dehydrogenase family)
MQIEGSVAVVTGAASGIGKSLSAALADAGARVVVGDLDAAGVAAVAEEIAGRGRAAIAHPGDASVPDDIRALIAAAASEFGPVDIYVANAGITGPPGLQIPETTWDRVLDVNLRAHIRAAEALAPEWVQRGRGYFVSVASAAGLLTQIGAAAYAVSKHAAVGFAEWLAITYGDDGIGVSCVCPMGVNTPLLADMRESPDATVQLAARAVTEAGGVLEPGLERQIPGAAAPRGSGHVSGQRYRLRRLDRRHAALSTKSCHPGLDIRAVGRGIGRGLRSCPLLGGDLRAR